MAINDLDIPHALFVYLEQYPDDTAQLSEPMQQLQQGRDFASRQTFPMHVTVGALLVRHGVEVLLVEHRAYGILLQPGGHLEATDTALIDAAMRELTEETGIDPGQVFSASRIPVYVEYGTVPVRPEKHEPEHYHLDFGYSFVTENADVGDIQQSEVNRAAWYPLAVAESLVGHRVARAVGQSNKSANDDPEILTSLRPREVAKIANGLIDRELGTDAQIAIPEYRKGVFIKYFGSVERVISAYKKYVDEVQDHLLNLDQASLEHDRANKRLGRSYFS